MTLPNHRDKRLAELAALSDGWLDGHGLAIEPGCLDRAREFLVAAEHLGTGQLSIFPTEDGGVLIENFGSEHIVSFEFDRSGIIDILVADTEAFLTSRETLLETTVDTAIEAVEALAAVLAPG